MGKSNFVFGYGSLVNILNLEQYLGRKLIPGADFIICNLNNFRRCWNVAMDNSLDLPDYKYYCDRLTGNRLPGFVTFLNIYSSESDAIAGILFSVTNAELQNLDRRERNYYRIDITAKIDANINGTAWTYVGLNEACKRYQTGLEQKNGMICGDYFNLVYDAYSLLGDRFLVHYTATTDKPIVPIVDLEKYRVK